MYKLFIQDLSTGKVEVDAVVDCAVGSFRVVATQETDIIHTNGFVLTDCDLGTVYEVIECVNESKDKLISEMAKKMAMSIMCRKDSETNKFSDDY